MTGSPYDTPAHDAYRDTLRHWVAHEVEPYAEAWDEAGGFPGDLFHLIIGTPASPGGTAWTRR